MNSENMYGDRSPVPWFVALHNIVRLLNYVGEINCMISRHKLTTVVQVNGYPHYRECVYTIPNNTCVPDTCVCQHIRGKRVLIEELLHETYNIVYSGNKTK